MAKFFIAIVVIVGALLAYWFAVFWGKYQISLSLIKQTTAYQKPSTDHSVTLLVVGDSTGVGVGASRPEDSVPARLAQAMSASYVENRAVSGAVVADVAGQLKQASLKKYSVILIQIGGNDIVRFHDAAKTAEMLAPVVRNAAAMSEHVFLMSAGNLGAVTNFPPFMRPFYTHITLQYHAEFGKMAAKEGAVYINLYQPPAEDPFTANPEKYLAADGFHPSSDGYGLWFAQLEKTLQQKK